MTKHEQAIRLSLRKHFEGAGVRFESSPEHIDQQLELLMGEERFSHWLELLDAQDTGDAGVGDHYALLQTAEEWNCCFSRQADVMLEVAVWLAGKISKHASKKATICDLGCGSGLLTSWLAKRHSTCRVIGVDAIENAIACAREQRRRENLVFQLWDYTNKKPRKMPRSSILVCGLGIDFGLWRHPHALEVGTERTGAFYLSRKQEALQYFMRWREAAVDGGRLFAVLRLPCHQHFLAVVDAAQESGWSFNSMESTKLSIGAQSLPALAFEARAGELANEDELLAFWAESAIDQTFDRPLIDSLAVLVFRSLGDKCILEVGRETFDCGNTMETILGTTHSLAFSFSHATTGFSRLEIVPLTQRERLKMRFAWEH
jgi:SAM-dependent methyltransferase